MKLAVLKERRPGEARVAASLDMVKKFAGLGVEVAIEAGAGAGSGIADGAFAAAGATLALHPAPARFSRCAARRWKGRGRSTSWR